MKSFNYYVYNVYLLWVTFLLLFAHLFYSNVVKVVILKLTVFYQIFYSWLL